MSVNYNDFTFAIGPNEKGEPEVTATHIPTGESAVILTITKYGLVHYEVPLVGFENQTWSKVGSKGIDWFGLAILLDGFDLTAPDGVKVTPF